MTAKSGTPRAVVIGSMAALALVPPVCMLLAEPFYVDLFTRIMIFGIAALSLDLILGYGGMASFGHAAFLGIGAYAVGIANYYGLDNGFAQFAIALLASAVIALFIGLVSLRTSGVFFIMITLAFSQMLYFLAISINTFGGADGMPLTEHSQFDGLLSLDNATVLYYFVLVSLAVFLWISIHIVRSRFGMVIRGAKSNDRRMAAIGYPTFRYKLTAFVISGAMCGYAGALLANQALFVSPAIMQWIRSGEILVMVIVGGISTLFGPVLGSVVYLVLEDTLSGWTEYWQLILGPILVLVVFFGKRGIVGLLARDRRGGSYG